MSKNRGGAFSGIDLCLDVFDKDSNRTVFHEEWRKKKALWHSELNDLSPDGFVKKRIPDALNSPLGIYEDLTDPKKRNYYKLYSQLDFFGRIIYNFTKVVVLTRCKPWVIVTAYECQNIKEKGDPKKCLYHK